MGALCMSKMIQIYFQSNPSWRVCAQIKILTFTALPKYIRFGPKLNHADILPIHPIIYGLRLCSLKTGRKMCWI